MIPLKDVVIDFLEDCRERILSQWNNKILISEKDPFKEGVLLNGQFMYDIVLKAISMPKNQIDQLLKPLSEKVAEERKNANINIGEFVYNVNLGRTIIFKNLCSLHTEWNKLQPSLDKVNYTFDQFLYYAVSKYSETQDMIIKEKNQYISSTHQDRLTLLGQMTSSFVHEFRNPLTSIHGFVQLLRADYPEIPYLDIISNELEQLKFSISQFLMLSKKEIIENKKTTVLLNDLIEQVLSFLYPRILEVNVEVQKEYKENYSILGYHDEIKQVLVNIIFNAIDVLLNIEHPIIRIKLDKQDSFVSLEIANNGPKIPESLIDHIFEPFVSQKESGTGLGLYVCKNTIEKHGGILTCHSTDEWTVFKILLPHT
ncbi:histidine kinase [Heyndrickxia shackletonii]|uniref:histidine kinase n=1 Tax=Heyndrickxia shackletonii TaxID=157838 RepID=A0A0Q3TMA5_9BACI|nr:histidine kinase N-terminal domain-containing protein [Heyndrickxia shackletonii]KQL55104.1 histidine kinase [Heyndrickxia shackletonii]MBB2482407.1 GHKL domain-containing protein [Bacillus sp. APMAM]NEY98816.1 GHKL domain-containing protein [Heyndrickxia shackletonii]RTZ54260.1 GHKL domain-containing protein [Bacillus sp. SAJ1]